MNERRIPVALGAIVVLGAATIGLAAVSHTGPFAKPSPVRSASPVDRGPVIATVNGQPIYLGEMESRVQGIQQVHGDFEQMFGKNWKHDLLQNLVDDKIIEQQAEARGISVSPQQIQQHVDRLRGQFPSQQEWEAFLDRSQMSEAELASRIRLQTIASELYLTVTDRASATRAELHAYYEKHRDKFPGVDGNGAPFLAVKDQIRKTVEKQKRDVLYARWLQRQREATTVVVVMPDWWKEIS